MSENGDPTVAGELEVSATARPSNGCPHTPATLDAVCDALDHMPGGALCATIDADGRLHFVGFSRGLLDLFQLDHDAVVGPVERLLEHVWVDDLQAHSNALLEHSIEGRAWVADIKVRTEIRRLWLRTVWTFAPGAEGDIDVTAVIYDITGHRQTAEALALNDAGFRAMLRSNRQAFLLLDPNNRILGYNEVLDGYALRLGRTLRLGEDFAELCPREIVPYYLEVAAQALRGEGYERRLEFTFPDDLTLTGDLVCAPVRSRTGQVIGCAISLIDVTRQVEAEQAVVESDRILSRLPLAVLTVSSDGSIDRLRGAADALLGLTGDGGEGSLVDILAPDERRRCWPLIADALRERRALRLELDGRRRDGTMVPLEMLLSPVADGDPLQGRTIVMLEDLGPRRALQRQLVESQKMEAVGLLAAGLAHDFNNLLAAIVGHTAMLDLDLPDGDPLRAEVAGIEATTRRAATLVRSLLGLARHRSSGARTVDLNDIVESAVPLLSRVAGAQCVLSASAADRPVCARIDPVQLEQVLVNLVVNARDAMPEGGSIAITLARVALDTRQSRALGMLAGEACRIEVRDNGTGMPAEIRERIFEPFFSTKPTGRGTGLGLSICRRILRSRGGEIAVETTEGMGTCMTLWLPFSDEPIRVSLPPTPWEDLPGGSERILLVEDVEELRLVWQRLLVRLGYRVEAVTDGMEAVQVLQQTQAFDLLLSDVVMPRLGGLALAERFREILPGAPIVLVSAFPGESLDAEVLSRLGAVVLRKPIDGPELARRLRELLDGAVQ